MTLQDWVNTKGAVDTKDILQAWVNGEITFEMAYEGLEDEMPYNVITGDTGLPEEWMADHALYLGVVFPE